MAKKVGRPSAFKPEFVAQAKKLCALGATEAELADFFGVSINTITNWKSQFEDFLGALKLGKETSDDRVSVSLYRRATGYTFDAVKIFMPAGAKKPVYAEYREHVPPDTTACIFWLKNRRPQEWRDVQRHEHGLPGEFERLDDMQLVEELRTDAEKLGLALPDEGDTAH